MDSPIPPLRIRTERSAGHGEGGGATGKQKIAPGGSTGNGTAWHRALSSGSSDGSLVPFFCLYSPEVTAHI